MLFKRTQEITVEVAYALPIEQVIIKTRIKEGATIEEAILASGILDRFKEIDLSVNKVGIFSKLSKLYGHVKDGDRIEIYRHLIADPKEIRRQRVTANSPNKKGST
ncbi:RnfH family protein [Methylovorus sp. MM2]|uniref:RnfH family protein n=1 Tax=Methylovorus sp. MM2 TaxID=1848038 RepID=UPI0007E1AB3B|nr:RnfH family protein [Methylovorus sp. MM2]OAM52776.1 RnfH family protein [Methylovorus sp. MM2]